MVVFPKELLILRTSRKTSQLLKKKEVTTTDANIQLPAYVFAYRTLSNKERDAYVLNMLSAYLSGGKSSVLYKKISRSGKKRLLKLHQFQTDLKMPEYFLSLQSQWDKHRNKYYKQK